MFDAQTLQKSLHSMPMVPDLAAKVLFMVEDRQSFSFADLEATISGDPGLTAKILKIANSAFYSHPREIAKLSTAISILGFNTIRSLVLLVTVGKAFENNRSKPFFQQYWRSSLLTAFRAQELALLTKRESLAEEMFTGALLHNIGQVPLHDADEQAYNSLLARAFETGVPLAQLETEVYGTDHKTLGAQVLDSWNFPPLYVDVAMEHGNENIVSAHKTAIVLISTAGFLTAAAQRPGTLQLSQIAGYLNHLNLEVPVLEAWNVEFQQRIETLPLYLECRSLFLRC